MEIASVICRSYCARANRHTRPVAKFHSKFMHRASIPFGEFRKMDEPINTWQNGKICDARTISFFRLSRNNLKRKKERSGKWYKNENTIDLEIRLVSTRGENMSQQQRVAWYEPRRRKLICWSQGQNAPPAGCKPLGLVMIQSSVKPAAAGLDRVAHVNCTIRGVTFSGYVYPRNPTSTVHLPAPRPLN